MRLLALACLLVAASTSAWAQPWDQEAQAKALYSCINDGFKQEPTALADFEASRPMRLRLKHQWRTKLPLALNLTVVTTATVGRLHQLRAQCNAWGGPLVAAIWAPLIRQGTEYAVMLDHGVDTPDNVQRQLAEFHHRVESAQECQLTLLLLEEAVAEEIVGALMPINSLRNYAILASTTPLVAMVDVDLLPSASLMASLQQKDRFDEILMLAEQRGVIVLPAFETKRTHELSRGQAIAEYAATLNKKQLKAEMVEKGDVHWFQQYDYRWGHASTNYYEWYKDSTTDFYQANPGNGYEPWFIAHRLLAPLYDQRFRGYGNDKISQVLAVKASGFSFYVHPSAFLVHRPHPKSKAFWTFVKRHEVTRRNLADNAAASSSGSAQPSAQQQHETFAYELKQVTARMFDSVKEDLAAGTPALLDDAVDSCRKTLPWWQLWLWPAGTAPAEPAVSAQGGGLAAAAKPPAAKQAAAKGIEPAGTASNNTSISH